MNKYLPGIFFVAAGVLLAVTKTPDIFTVTAVGACALVAALSCTRYTVWSAIGGVLLIGSSLTLQSVLSYRCIDCIKADLLIMAGVICVSVLESSGIKRALRVMSAVTTVMLMANALLHYPLLTGNPLDTQQSSNIGQFINVTSGGQVITLDTAAKSVLMFSPSCGACKTAIEELVKADPDGKGWTAVQVSGSPEEGTDLLQGNGYRGVNYQHNGWDNVVPALVTNSGGNTQVVFGTDGIVKAVKGEGR